MKVKIPSEISKKYIIVGLPCNPATIAGRTIDFNNLTEAEAQWLLSIKCPHIRKSEEKKAK